MARYCHIRSTFSDTTLSGRTFINRKGGVSPVVFPLLPNLLAACAPSTELSLIVEADQGKLTAGNYLLASITLILEAS